METWRDRFDKKFNLPHWEHTGYNLNFVRDFFSAELLLLAEGLEKEKKVHGTGFSNATVKRKAYNHALDLAISHLKEAAK